MVYFTGAGSGAKDLITVRGKELLEKADVVIYAGSLVNPALLEYCKKEVRLYDSAFLNLEETTEIIKNAEEKGLVTVRLHTGEPSLYGAVREQMDALDKAGINYESCPGVTACFAAAASLDLEYTLPDVSQTLIISRMEGRTKVPEGESIRLLASHKASMAIYLSTGLIPELVRELRAGGYDDETPAAIVYKASWPEEEKYICTVGSLDKTAKEHDLKKTAVILVGDFINKKAAVSRLYAKEFETGFRKNKEKKYGELAVAAFSEKGRELAKSLEPYFTKIVYYLNDIKQFSETQFKQRRPLLFIGAAGIAVRSIAGCISDKLKDIPVLVMDERGKHVIPVLSGHMGGANELAEYIAGKTGAIPVLTTGTDVNGSFAADIFAKKNYLKIKDRKDIERANSKSLRGETVRIKITGKTKLPEGDGYIFTDTDEDIELTPKRFAVGMGCKKGKNFEDLNDLYERILRECGIDKEDVAAIVSAKVKEEEAGLIRLAQYHAVNFETYPSEELEKLEGRFSASGFVKEKTGTDNVCERAAVYFCSKICKDEYKLILKKYAENGMTIAIAERIFE